MAGNATGNPSTRVEPGTLVLTPNATLAEALLRREMQKTQARTMRVGSIFSLTEWLQHQLTADQQQSLATDIQLQILWEEVLMAHDLPFDLHAPTLAPLALQAWRHLRQWRVPEKELAQAEYNQNIQFNHWCREFDAQLEKLGLQTLEQLAEQRLVDNRARSLRKIILVDFIEPPPPLWRAVMEHIADEVMTSELEVATGTASYYAAADPQDELVAATQWAQQSLQTQPQARIALISTQGREVLAKLERHLWNSGIQARSAQVLRNNGLINAALALLKINLPNIELADARTIIQSPFIGDYPADLFNRARGEERICALETRSLSRSDFFHCVREFATLTAISGSLGRQSSRQSPARWADMFQQQLYQLGWPGSRALNPEQTQALNEWSEVLGDLASLSSLCDPIDAGRALHLVEQLTQTRSCSTNGTARVHLLDRVEAAFDYDQIWMLGADDEHWPSAPAPQPLLPLSIQNRYGMPHCSAEHELVLCERLLASMQRRGGEVIFSFAQSDGDQQRRLTPVLSGLPVRNLQPASKRDLDSAEFEWVDSSTAPPLALDQLEVTGGSYLLQLMAASPFDAFVTYRLRTRPLCKPFEGVSPMQMGLLIHDLLDRVWSNIRSSQNLRAINDTQLSQLIESQVEATLRDWKSAWRLGSRQRGLTARRLQQLLEQWLPLELDRGDFDVVDTERDIELELGGIRLRLRIDRIDQVKDGLLLIDYKSGSTGKIDDWRSSPPTEPQLPLYTLAHADDFVGIAFARVKIGEMKWISLGTATHLTRMVVVENWHELKKNWEKDLTRLAQDFAQGDARVRETISGYFQDDPLRALHRFNEFDELEKCRPTT